MYDNNVIYYTNKFNRIRCINRNKHIFFAILLLLKALTTSSLVEFSSFPALLLISTLFRLAITVSSTRLILSEANAGNIIETFGEFVTRGNMVIGGVVFSIVTIVNFVVITKGSERIGEVSSRFFSRCIAW